MSELQSDNGKKEKRTHTRLSVLGFFVRNPPRQFGNAISFFNTSITHTQYTWAHYNVKDIQLVTFEATTAFRIRLEGQQYFSGWTVILKHMFSHAASLIGEDLFPDLCETTSERVKKMFKNMEKIPQSKASIYAIQTQIQQVTMIYFIGVHNIKAILHELHKLMFFVQPFLFTTKSELMFFCF